MKNKFNKGELVVINGIGKDTGKEYINVFGFIEEKDYYFGQYKVNIMFDTSDWFHEKSLKRVFDKENKKIHKYKVCFSTSKKGLDFILKKMDNVENKTIDLFKQADIFQKYVVDNKEYFYIVWSNTYWPYNNPTVRTINKCLPILKRENIAYQFISIGINEKQDIKINEFTKNDKNVDVFELAGIMDKGQYVATEEGSAQGNIISPVLANIYMHFVLVLWYKEIIEKRAEGENFLVVYADDFIAGFQYQREAQAYYEALKKRVSKFGLELESSKSKIIKFGKFAEQNRKALGQGKPETFDFLGFTFYCSRTRQGKPCIKVKTSKKKFKQKVKAMKVWLYENRDIRVRELMEKLRIKLLGHYRYYGISHNSNFSLFD